MLCKGERKPPKVAGVMGGVNYIETIPVVLSSNLCSPVQTSWVMGRVKARVQLGSKARSRVKVRVRYVF